MSTAPMGPAELADKAGQEIGVSSWIEVGQQRIDEFAHCTEDRQWIHVDVERAAKESPAGGTIAHGYLTLALLAPTGMEILVPRVRAKQ
ncbi:MAG TPA: MaoC/PaaZ C-terminal domain-containing protein, partial [Thermomonas sp.]|nr:MaoC/PaaZ C-terminal domain-containing protein [Thermomonas sp.]